MHYLCWRVTHYFSLNAKIWKQFVRKETDRHLKCRIFMLLYRMILTLTLPFLSFLLLFPIFFAFVLVLDLGLFFFI